FRTLTPQSPCQRRFAPTAVHLRSGMPFGFPPESMFTFTGIPRRLTKTEYPLVFFEACSMARDNADQPQARRNDFVVEIDGIGVGVFEQHGTET
ncbi:MAG: hypothetical protein WB762_14430, partial [Candidatus Sulfotelmatobacter sp.]